MKHLKEELAKLSLKDMIIYLLTLITMISGLVLLFAGLYIPPQGEIHQSVLTAFGIICVFVASLLGVTIHFENELEKLKTNIQNQIQGLAQ